MNLKNIIIVVITACLAAGVLGGVFLYRRYEAREAAQLVAAKKQKEDITVTIPEGWRTSQITEYLEKKTSLQSKFFVTSLKTHPRPRIDGAPAMKLSDSAEEVLVKWEGMLFPDTYRLTDPISADEAVDKFASNFEKKFFTAEEGAVKTLKGYKFQAHGLELSGYEVLILASIIEKETGRNLSTLGDNSRERLQEERKTVAGIFLNRLKIGQALQSDATVNYATGKNVAAASLEDLEKNSPYNTYKYPGLPPTPICNPSLMSLIAAFQPIKTDYLYFLHKQPSGEVVYSKTFDEHVQNKYKYLK
ncbi:MAG TPA: endolytic transglycosylase MltG [Patescibacteria group bacterium]|nr:endolytic transglycosylase MltG [Patescibacteria group bacterium]